MEGMQYSIRSRVTMDQKCSLKVEHNQTGLEEKARLMMHCTEKLVASFNLKMELSLLISSTKQEDQQAKD